MSTGKVYLKWDIGFQGLDIYLSICMLYVDWEILSQKGLKASGLGYLSIFVLLCRLGKFKASGLGYLSIFVLLCRLGKFISSGT